MAHPPIRWRPDRRTLAQFAEAWMFFLGMVVAPLELHRGRPTSAAISWGLAVLGRLIGMVRPGLLRWPYLALALLTWPIGWLVGNVLLALVYYLVVTPIGLALRLRGYDPLGRSFDRAAESYWEPYNPDRGLDRYLKQF